MKTKSFSNYAKQVSAAAKHIDPRGLESVIYAISSASLILVGGNGGSAALANHFCGDLVKIPQLPPAVSLSANPSVLTAIANDDSYELSLTSQLHRYSQLDRLVVLLISSSGRSKNIVSAAEFLTYSNQTLIGLTGFDGGDLKNLAQFSIHVPSTNYGVVEDTHSMILHYISQSLKERLA